LSARPGGDIHTFFSRRRFLTRCAAAAAGFSHASAKFFPPPSSGRLQSSAPASASELLRFTPHYPQGAPIDEVLRYLRPGLDEFVVEKYAEQVEGVLAAWSDSLRRSPADLGAVAQALSPEFQGSSWQAYQDQVIRPGPALEVKRRRFAGEALQSAHSFLAGLRDLLGSGRTVPTAQFKLPELTVRSEQPLRLATSIRYDLVLQGPGSQREEHAGLWELAWRQANDKLQVESWKLVEETFSRSTRPFFVDVTEEVLGANASYQQQLRPGVDYWRTVLDQASGIDVYGNNGLAVGDIDNDGFDEVYVCQPSGLPNRLYRNRADGRFTDITEQAGVGVLDNTPCALFADLDNRGRQDLLVVTAGGPLLFLNQGDGTFAFKPAAFHFQQPPQGTFTGAAFGDYDRDGFLDIYFCLYSYYKGLDQYQYPRPYYDARNGPPNFLLRNQGGGSFEDVTERSGLNQNNDRYSFDCTWCDYNEDGWPDLYVVNDFGSKNLYRNNGDGTFTDVAEQAGVLDVGPGMSSCWFDSRASGREDLYVSDMWEPAGLRVTHCPAFLPDQPETIRRLYRRHPQGNSLYRNAGAGHFEDVSVAAGVERTGWSWSSDAWDFDQDGYSDLYVANGMISGPQPYDCESFFWRQVVARSPSSASPSRRYELGWDAINDLIRSDFTWAGYQRNVFFLNNRDGTFSEVSGAVGLDFPDDSRAFALTDLDGDGRLEVFLKNRSGPQIRVLRNTLPVDWDAIAIRLQGTKSNRDAVGAVATVECTGRRQRQMLRAGSGFVSQHTKELLFGLGDCAGPVQVQVRWPSGALQGFDSVPRNHRIEIIEGHKEFRATPFASSSRPIPSPEAGNVEASLSVGHGGHGSGGLRPSSFRRSESAATTTGLSSDVPTALPVETWLIEPIPAPEFEIPDASGRPLKLSDLHGRCTLLYFWALDSSTCRSDLERLNRRRPEWAVRGLEIVAVNLDGPGRMGEVRALAEQHDLGLHGLTASPDVAGVYNLLFRYLFDRRRNLALPTSFLLDTSGAIVKVLQGPSDFDRLARDVERIPSTAEDRARLALPFPGRHYGGEFARNFFTYGTAYFQAGYIDEAIHSFEIVLRSDPNNAQACYNLGTLFLQKNEIEPARQVLMRALEIRPEYPDALNDLGLIAAREGKSDDAVAYFQKAIAARPDYVLALENLGNLYRGRRQWDQAQRALEQALKIEPANAELSYAMGMLFAEQGDAARAESYLKQAVKLRPGYPEAWNNLGVLYVRQGDETDKTKALAAFQQCIEAAPDFAQAYYNLARVYVGLGDKQRAAEVLRQLLKRRPGDAQASAELERLEH
jgi:tetratricopeptide (TPR) repeat protein